MGGIANRPTSEWRAGSYASQPITSALVLVLVARARADRPAAAEATPPEECTHLGLPGDPYQVGVNCRVMEVDGHPREFIVYRPDRDPEPGQRVPVVFMFHGSTGTHTQFLRISGWREQADATGLVAVFHRGLRYRVLDSGRLSSKWNSFDLASRSTSASGPAATGKLTVASR